MACKGRSVVMHTAKEKLFRLSEENTEREIVVMCNGARKYHSVGKDVTLILSAFATDHDEEYGMLSPLSAVMLGYEDLENYYYVVISEDSKTFVVECFLVCLINAGCGRACSQQSGEATIQLA